MELVTRSLEDVIKKHLFESKAIILYGARQVGKTTLVNQILKGYSEKILFLNGDHADVREVFSGITSKSLIPVIGDYKIIVLDEAQRIPETGLALKIIHDNFKDVQLIATGSSSFELADKIRESLTGRKYEFHLHTFSLSEMVKYHGYLAEKSLIPHRLVFGSYPDIVLNPGNEIINLKSLASSYLYKDLLVLDQVRKPVLLEKLLKALAFQVGNEVSYNELSQITGSDKGTVEKYIDLLEKAYIIFKLPAFSRNLRNEIKQSKKIYFYDNGIRNAAIGNFTPLSSRDDAGVLWENFLVSERVKFLDNTQADLRMYFWRTTQRQEIDFIEERDSKLFAYEFKWNARKKHSVPRTFSGAYPGTVFRVITSDNMDTFLLNI